MKLLFLFLFLSLVGKEPSESGIPYRTLSWQDFRKPAPADQISTAAKATTELQLETTEIDRHFTYVVKAYFLPYSSYVRLKSALNLAHEQNHFRIAYIASLECMQEIAPFQNRDSVAQRQVEQIYNKYVIQKESENERFDAETAHGLRLNEEQEWENKTRRLLKALEKEPPDKRK